MTFQTFTPIEYLKIDIASNFGLDKETWDTRINWFDDNEDNLGDLISEAEEPALYAAGLFAYDQALKGQPVHYMISLDATASGAQLMSIAVGCDKSAKMCNVIDTGERKDFYKEIHKGVVRRCPDVDDITHAQSKQAGMTHLYNSRHEPRKAYGADSPALEAFYQTFAEDAPGVEQLNQAIYRMRNPEATEYTWVLPDNFHAGYKVEDLSFYNVEFMGQEETITIKTQQPNDQDRALGANSVHSVDGLIVREMGRRCDYDKDTHIQLKKMLTYSSWRDVEPNHTYSTDDKMVLALWDHYTKTNFLSARILDYLTPANIHMVDRAPVLALLDSMPKQPFNILSVHDCFRCHPNYGNDLRKQYNQILAELASSTVFDNLLSQATKKSWFIPKFSDISSDVLEANYALS